MDEYRVKGEDRQSRQDKQRRAMRLNGRAFKGLLVDRAAQAQKGNKS
jgi:hypothetical protein